MMKVGESMWVLVNVMGMGEVEAGEQFNLPDVTARSCIDEIMTFCEFVAELSRETNLVQPRGVSM